MNKKITDMVRSEVQIQINTAEKKGMLAIAIGMVGTGIFTTIVNRKMNKNVQGSVDDVAASVQELNNMYRNDITEMSNIVKKNAGEKEELLKGISETLVKQNQYMEESVRLFSRMNFMLDEQEDDYTEEPVNDNQESGDQKSEE